MSRERLSPGNLGLAQLGAVGSLLPSQELGRGSGGGRTWVVHGVEWGRWARWRSRGRVPLLSQCTTWNRTPSTCQALGIQYRWKVKALALVQLVHSLFSRARDESKCLCFLRMNLPTEDALFPSLEGSSWTNAERGPKGPYLIGFLTS